MTDLPENTYAHMNQDGLMEIIDVFTGQVLLVQKSRERLLFGETDSLTKTVLPDGQIIYTEKSLGEMPKINRYVYSALQAAAISHLVAEGKSIREIARIPGFPSVQVIRAWRRLNPEFEELLTLAKKDRAEFYQEKAMDSVDNIVSKDDASAAKVKFEAYKWAASVDDPDIFGAKTKISGDLTAPLTLMIDTGIRRQGEIQAPIPRIEEIPSPGILESNVDPVDDLPETQSSADESPELKF